LSALAFASVVSVSATRVSPSPGRPTRAGDDAGGVTPADRVRSGIRRQFDGRARWLSVVLTGVAAGLDVQDEVRGDGGDLLEVQRCGLERRVWAGSRGGAEAEQLSATPPSSGRHRVRVVVR
jgi:hypothetical protein